MKKPYFTNFIFKKVLKMKLYITFIILEEKKMKKKSLVARLKRSAVIGVFLLILISVAGMTCCGQLSADTYAPIFYFEGEETCYPIDASYHLDNSQLNCIELNLEETCYYDNLYGTIKDDGVINHYQSVMNSYDFTIYYRTIDDTATGSTIIQYWMFYAFNKGELNQHEGDWEMVQVVFDNDVPSWVAYSQHHSGQKATWSQVEKDGNNIKVYVARGSHANYLRSYSGKFGIASDIVGANGKILNPVEYTLDTLEDKTWIDFEGRWGELADTEANAIEASILGQAGPEGPKFRENGEMWDNPIKWGESLFESNDMLFTLEWFLYNFITIFIVISLIIIAIMAFRIYRGHKKYGLGPRIVSMLYINGFNLHSIGNILCFLGIILAIIGLFNPWYLISYGVSGEGITETFQTGGMIDLLKFDGITGLQVTIPGTSGPIPLGSFVLPFSLFIAIGLIFLIIATIGIPLSKKLGSKYIWRGVRLIIPFILIVIAIMAMGAVIPTTPVEAGTDTNYAQDILDSISGSPFGGQTSTYISENGITGQVDVQWGLGLGGWLLLIAGIIIIIAGILELVARTQFFTTKIPLGGQIPPGMQIPPSQTAPPSKEPQPSSKQKAPTKGKYEATFCTECGEKLEENATFCVKCGKKTGK